MAEEGQAPKAAGRVWLDLAVFGGAFVLPPLLVVSIYLAAGDGNSSLALIRPVAVIGPVVVFLCRVFLSLYFPPFWVNGSVDPVLALLGLYLLFAAVYMVRRRWMYAAVLLIVPLVCTWVLTWRLLRGD